ncbi:hypothetical protein AB0284_21515 [Pseudarthrobacter phenanthrenivorans]|uniref:hypothetical protein n=1 Tax=Pseudarthrobacter phenanthrenivorans TaxID=361575 RepID=UPI0034505B02
MTDRTCSTCGQRIAWSENFWDDGGKWLHFIGPWMVGTACPSPEAIEHFKEMCHD